MSIPALDQAIGLFPSQSDFAARIGIRCASVSGWRKRQKVPANRCLAIEEATAGKVTRYQLRPDVFGDAPPPDLREAG